MRLRSSFAGGLVFGLVGALGFAALVPVTSADERPKDVRLLVSCDAAARGRVLDALRGLDVTVHDLATMERVGGDPSAVAVPAVVNARRVFSEVMAAVDAARKVAEPAKVLTVVSIVVEDHA